MARICKMRSEKRSWRRWTPFQQAGVQAPDPPSRRDRWEWFGCPSSLHTCNCHSKGVIVENQLQNCIPQQCNWVGFHFNNPNLGVNIRVYKTQSLLDPNTICQYWCKHFGFKTKPLAHNPKNPSKARQSFETRFWTQLQPKSRNW